jgi:hypothetical protein
MNAHAPAQGNPSSLAVLRRKLAKHRRIAMMIRAIRALIHFGPWRNAARQNIRLRRPPAHPAPIVSLIPNLDAMVVADAVRAESVCMVGRLPNRVVDDIRELTDHLPPNEYGSFNERHAAVQRLVEDSGVWAVARNYFGAEPVLLECNLVVQQSEEGRDVARTSQRRFHFDYAGWHSLNLFVYLTDVEADSGAHQVVVGTHKYKLMRDAIRPSLDDDEVQRRFGTKIRTISGPAGTLFFEDTEAFHRRLAVKHRRVMLNILFASHRSAFSQGRLVKPHRELVARIDAGWRQVAHEMGVTQRAIRPSLASEGPTILHSANANHHAL